MDKGAVKIAVIEDEMIVGAKLSMYLSELGYEVTGIIGQSDEVMHHIDLNAPDIVLLDIQLRGTMDGVELAHRLHTEGKVRVVFLTANADDATFERAKETGPDAFLTKPFKKVDLKHALELVVNRMSEKSNPANETERPHEENQAGSPLADRIFVLDKGKKVRIMLDSILYIEAERNYCHVITTDKKFLLSMPLKNLERVLPSKNFQRIHRSYIVNLTRVDEIDESSVVVGGTLLGVSKSYRSDFLKRIRSV